MRRQEYNKELGKLVKSAYQEIEDIKNGPSSVENVFGGRVSKQELLESAKERLDSLLRRHKISPYDQIIQALNSKLRGRVTLKADYGRIDGILKLYESSLNDFPIYTVGMFMFIPESVDNIDLANNVIYIR